MDTSRLKIRFSGHRPTTDGKTFEYNFSIEYGRLKWNLKKRFSDFVNLQSQLRSVDNLAGISGLPAKTLFGRPNEPDVLRQRQRSLAKFLGGLVARPDTRTSDTLLRFLDFEAQTHAVVRSVAPTCCTATTPTHRIPSRTQYGGENLLFISFEDSSSLSRMGRVWQIVEPDEAGAFAVWKIGKSEVSRKLHKLKIEKVRSLFFFEEERKLFVGLGSGEVEIYRKVPRFTSKGKMAEDPLSAPNIVLKFHEGAVICMDGGQSKLMSLGFDGSLKLMDMKEESLVCGGRLTRRLLESTLTCGHLDEARDRAFLGTSAGELLIFDISGNPPRYIYSLKGCKDHIAPIASIVRSDDVLYLGVDDLVSIVRFPAIGEENTQCRVVGSYSSPLENDRTVRSLTPWPERQWLLVGHDGALSVWDAIDGSCICAVRVQAGVKDVIVLPNDDSEGSPEGRGEEYDRVLLVDGNGSVQIWRFLPQSFFETWAEDELCFSVNEKSEGYHDHQQLASNADQPRSVQPSKRVPSQSRRNHTETDVHECVRVSHVSPDASLSQLRNPVFMKESLDSSDDEFNSGVDLHDVLAPAKL